MKLREGAKDEYSERLRWSTQTWQHQHGIEGDRNPELKPGWYYKVKQSLQTGGNGGPRTTFSRG